MNMLPEALRLRPRASLPLVSALLAAATSLLPPPAHAETLEQILRQAQQYDPQLESARAARLVKGDSVTQERARLLPQVGMTVDRRRIENRVGAADPRAYDSQNASLSLRQSLFNPAAWHSYQQSKLGELMGEVALMQAEQALRLRVAQAYIAALAAREDVKLFDKRIRTLEDLLHGVKRRFEEGKATVIDVSQAQADLTTVRSQAVEAAGKFDIALGELGELVGHPVRDLADLKPGLPAPDFSPQALTRWLEKAERNDFGVHLQALAVHVAQREVAKAKSEFLPTAELVGSYSKGKSIFAPGLEINNSSVRQGTNSIGVTVTVPLFNGLSTVGRVSQARHQAQQANAELSRARHTARSAASRAFLSGRTGLDQIAASRAALESAQFAFDAVNKGYQYGKKSLTDVSLAADKLFQANRDQVRFQHDFTTSYLNLLSSTGELDDASILALSGPAASAAGPRN